MIGEISALDVYQLLDEITSRPAPHMLHHIPAKFEVRGAELLRDAVNKHADAELEASRHSTGENIANAKFWSQHLWALSPALLAIPADIRNEKNAQQQHTNFAMAEVVRSRLQKAECGQWQALFAELLQLQRQDTRHLQERFVSSTLADSGGEDFVFDKTSQKVRGTNLQTAKNILMGQSVARMDDATATQMRDLIAAPIPPDEAEALAAEVHKLRTEKSPHKNVKKSVLRRRLALLNTGAEPGPSGLRNGTLMSIRQARNGVDALQKWTSMWCSGNVVQFTTELWTAGISIPVDCGPREETPTGRKLRPITLSESLPKLAEAVVLDELVEAITKLFEPEQLGVGTADGNIILLRALQNWCHDIEEGNAQKLQQNDIENLEAVLALDLTNAYGMFHRSGAIAEVRVSLPGLLGVVKAQWQNEKNSFWMRVDGRWVKSVTKRGGFQGLRFITVMFCLALKRSVREGRPVSGNDLAMPGYQDDCYLVGKLQSIADTWQNLASALAKGWHVVNPLKTEYWIQASMLCR